MLGETHRLHKQLNALEGTIVDEAIDTLNTTQTPGIYQE
jgi:hypothetical protein